MKSREMSSTKTEPPGHSPEKCLGHSAENFDPGGKAFSCGKSMGVLRKTLYKFWIYHTYVSFSRVYNSWDILGLYWDLIFAHSAIFSDMDFPVSIFV